MRIISIVGKKNSGKTSLTVKIINELIKRNYKVASIKHSHHKMEMDKKNTDTWKHRKAGAKTVVGIGKESFFTINKELPLERLLFLIKIIDEPDFVVIEGFKKYNYAKIAVSKELEDEYTIDTVNALKLNNKELLSLVDKVEKYSYDIINTLNAKDCGYKKGKSIGKAIIKEKIDYDPNDNATVSLSIDEKIIGLNYFVSDFMKNNILGMIKSLKTKEYGVEDFKKIEIVIKNE